MKPKISIIVPVYKVENYLCQCVDSILAQTYTNWELLLIDDGSPDNSGSICDYYANSDKRIKVFHKENAGVSSARNLGLEYAQGDWICFVDSDDWICIDALCSILELDNGNIDCIQYGFKYVKSNNEVVFQSKIPKSSNILPKEVYFEKLLYHSGICGYLLKSDIIKNNKIEFLDNIKYGEDQAFIFSALACANNIGVLDKHLYFYRCRDGSAMTSPMSLERAMNHLSVINEIAPFMIERNLISSVLFQQIFRSFIHSYFWIATRGISDYKKIFRIKECYDIFCKEIKHRSDKLYKYASLYNYYFLIIIYYIYVRIKE